MNLEQIEEWTREVELRPASAPLIIQYISRRLLDLTQRNQELLADNIELRTGKKVEEYESRIANLEYQLALLKRQINGESREPTGPAGADTFSVILYDTQGRIIRIETLAELLADGREVARVDLDDSEGFLPPRMLVTDPREELMFVFDSGRIVTMPLTALAVSVEPGLRWAAAAQVELHAGEELVSITPVGKMSLYDFCVQVSRRGSAKRMMRSSFEKFVASRYIGTGVKIKSDKTCCLVFAGKEDRLALVSKEGFVVTEDTGALPYTTEEIVRLSPTDHIFTAFVTGQKPSVVFITQNGKVIHRETSWLEKIESFRSRGQAVFSQSRRNAGIRVIGAAAVDENDWAMFMNAKGSIFSQKVSALLAVGAVSEQAVSSYESTFELTAFAPFAVRDSG